MISLIWTSLASHTSHPEKSTTLLPGREKRLYHADAYHYKQKRPMKKYNKRRKNKILEDFDPSICYTCPTNGEP